MINEKPDKTKCPHCGAAYKKIICPNCLKPFTCTGHQRRTFCTDKCRHESWRKRKAEVKA